MAWFTRLSLQTRILSIMLLVVALGIAATVSVLTWRASEIAKRSALEYAQTLAQAQAAKSEMRLNMAIQSSRSVAAMLKGMKESGRTNRELAMQMLVQNVKEHPYLIGTSAAWEPNAFDGRDAEFVNAPAHDATGRFVPYTHPSDNGFVIEVLPDYETEKDGLGDYYLLSKKSNKETILEPYMFTMSGVDTLMTTITTPIRDAAGQFIGATTVDLPINGFQDEVGQIRPFETGFARMLSNQSMFLADRDVANLGAQAPESVVPPEARQAIAAGQPFQTRVFDEALGTYLIQAYAPMKIGETVTPWSFMVAIPEDKILSEAAMLRNMAFVLGFISLVVMGAVLTISLRQMVLRPLGGDPADAARIARSIAQGRLYEHIPQTTSRQSTLMNELAGMQTSLKDMVRGIGVVSRDVADTAHSLERGNQDMADRNMQQAAALEESSASIDELAKSVRNNRDRARHASGTAQDASRDATKGKQTVEDIAINMRRIASQSQQMSDIVSMIEGIAFQTNILALNAAVEAARAGDHGRGFAVVAAEVRELALRSSKSAKEIQSMISGITHQISEGATRVGDAETLIADLEKQIVQVDQVMQEIAGSADEQTRGIEQINTAVHELDKATNQNSVLVDTNASHSGNLVKQSGQLLQSVSKFQLTADGGPQPDQAFREQGFARLDDTSVRQPANHGTAAKVRKRRPAALSA